ncbi:MAG TPA: hypothetical protein VFB59_03905 [Candidatus Saccharimonadales bacterium]|nr:hypothetical protein [Candidatus Saccharimonadales bacterium]
MKSPNHWQNPLPYPDFNSISANDIGYFNRVTDAYFAALGDPDIQAGSVEERGRFPTDVLLLGMVEDKVWTGSEQEIRRQALGHPKGVLTDTEMFEIVAEEVTDSVFYGAGPGARIIVPGNNDRWQLLERNQYLIVPELDRNDEPTGQFVGVPAYNIPAGFTDGARFDPQEGDTVQDVWGRVIDDPTPHEVATTPVKKQLNVAPWAGNIVVPGLVTVGVVYEQSIADPALSHHRKVVEAWYYLPYDGVPHIPKQVVGA